ncbi:MAG: hypothetical protein ACXWDO_06660, partial [Bacteroidia bacterium]
PKSWAVIPFYITASIAFLALCVMLFFSVSNLNAHFFQPRLLALVHTAALGWATMVIFGATYQLLPVIFENDLYSSKLAFASYLLLLPGTVLLVYSFWVFDSGIMMQAGGLLVFAAVICFVWNVLFTAQESDKYSIQKTYIFTAGLWFLVTVTFGVLLVFNFSRMLFHDHLQILKLHAHAGIAGWFLMMIIGVGSKLLPMFLLGKSGKTKYLNLAYYFINAGLVLFLVDGYFAGITIRSLLYTLFITAGIVFFLVYMQDVFKNRLRKSLDFPMKWSMASLPIMLLAIMLIPFMFYFPKAFFLTSVYGALIFLGWITSLIMGQTFKTLPFIVWNSRYKDLSGKQKIPMPKHLYHENIIQYQFYIYLAGFVLLVGGIASGLQLIMQAAAILLIIVALLYIFNVFTIIFRKPAMPI